jgi:Mn-containing catalase
MTREITHMKAFQAAVESMEKQPFSVGMLKPTPGIVDEYFNGSTGDGSEGGSDMRGPWTSSFGLHPVESQMMTHRKPQHLLKPKRLVKPSQLEAGTRKARLRRNIPNDFVGVIAQIAPTPSS